MAGSTSRVYRNGHVEIPYNFERTARRTIGLTVYPGGDVRVRAPRRVAEAEILGFLRRKERWLVQKVGELQALPGRHASTWNDGGELPLLGRRVRLHVAGDHRPGEAAGHTRGGRCAGVERIMVSRTGMTVLPPQRSGMWPPEEAALHRVVSRWYHRRAEHLFAHRMQQLRTDPVIARLGEPGPVSVRRMRRRWGSCFRDGRITLNTELMGEPIAHIDYVIVHELCHLSEHNHGPGFYRLLDRAMPDWRDRRGALHRTANAGFLDPPSG